MGGNKVYYFGWGPKLSPSIKHVFNKTQSSACFGYRVVVQSLEKRRQTPNAIFLIKDPGSA